MASDRLFEMLAQARAQPDRWARSVNAGAQAGQDILGGYLKGKEVKQQIDQYRLLQTPLGSMYSDPSQIPFGLSPQHTVKDLLTLAPAMENYVPSSLISGAGKAFGVDTSDNSAPPASAPAPAPQPPIPIAGSANPAPTPGTTALNSIAGDGSGGGGAVAPGASPTIPSGGMKMNVPAGGMGMKGFQNIVLPALKAGQEERQFQQRQGSEESRFERGQNAEESRFQRGHMATAAEKIGSTTETLTGLNQFINELTPLVANNHPAPFVGTVGGNISRESGGYGTPSMKNAMKIDDTAGKASALLDKQLAGRFNQQEADLLKKVMVPSGKDQGGYDAQGNPNYGQDKLNKLQAFSKALNSGNEQIVRNMASAMTGGAISVVPPSSTNNQGPTNSNQTPITNYASESDVPSTLPKGTRIKIKGRLAVIR